MLPKIGGDLLHLLYVPLDLTPCVGNGDYLPWAELQLGSPAQQKAWCLLEAFMSTAEVGVFCVECLSEKRHLKIIYRIK